MSCYVFCRIDERIKLFGISIIVKTDWKQDYWTVSLFILKWLSSVDFFNKMQCIAEV